MQTLSDLSSQVQESRAFEVAQEVAKLARVSLDFDIQVIWFGSWPKGTAMSRSDIDIALAGNGPIPLDQFSRLRDAIGDLPTLYQVDLVDLSSVGEELRQEIHQYGIAL